MITIDSPIYAVFANILFIMGAWCIGYPFLKWLNKNRKENFFPVDLIAPVIGMNLFAFVFFLISSTGIFKYLSPSYLAVPLSIYAVIVIFLLKKGKKFKTISFKWPYILFFILGLILLGTSLSPPLGWDEMVYHHPIVQRWMNDGFPKIYLDLPYSGFPSSNGFIFWFLSDMGGIITPRLFIWFCWMLNCCILFKLLIKQGLEKRIASVFVIAFSFSPIMILITADGLVEIIILLNLTTVLYLFTPVYYENNSEVIQSREFYKLAFLFAILAAGQASIKLTGIILFAVPFLLLLFHTPRELVIKQKVRISIFMAACWFLMILPFYLRPFIITGNPFYPYFSWLFTDSSSTIAMSEYHHAIGADWYGSFSIPMFFYAPIALMFSHKIFEGSLGWQLAVILMISIWGMIFKLKKRNLLFCMMSGVLYVFWFFTAQQARFIIPAVLILYYFAGLQIRGIKKNYRTITASLLIILTLISFPLSSARYYYFSWRQLLGNIKFIDYFYNATEFKYLEMLDAVRMLTPEDSKIMMLYEHRLLYFPRKCEIGTPYFQEKYFTPPENLTEEDVVKTLTDNNFDYLLFFFLKSGNPDFNKDYFAKSKKLGLIIDEMIKKNKLVPVWNSEYHILLKVNFSKNNKTDKAHETGK